MFLKFQYIRMKKLPASEKRMILQDDFGIQMEMDLESEVTDVGHVLDDVAQRNYEKGVCESLVSSIKTLTETMNWSVDQACLLYTSRNRRNSLQAVRSWAKSLVSSVLVLSEAWWQMQQLPLEWRFMDMIHTFPSMQHGILSLIHI